MAFVTKSTWNGRSVANVVILGMSGKLAMVPVVRQSSSHRCLTKERVLAKGGIRMNSKGNWEIILGGRLRAVVETREEAVREKQRLEEMFIEALLGEDDHTLY
jgi:hypothetical protein